MIKSKVLRLESSGNEIGEVLEEAEKFAKDIGLSERESRRLRLMVEDTMSMIEAVTGEIDLHLSFIERDAGYMIHLETDTFMNLQKREELLSLSKSGKNESAVGIMGKIREAFEMTFLMPNLLAGQEWATAASPAMLMGMPGDIGTGGASDYINTVYWSLSKYRSSIDTDLTDEEVKEAAWDELEKSIIGNLADDVKVGISDNHVVVDVYVDKK
ncbi:MAG: hypothetical protein K6B28_13515 [Lachnospiraceae bacterium]|nr:hypothetical protein [Lachnospiraceae bacterium]